MEEKNIITHSGQRKMFWFSLAGAILMVLGFFSTMVLAETIFPSVFLSLNLFLSGVIVLIFGRLMKKRTPEGAELAWKIEGFNLFMETVDKYRAEFYEKEYIFEKFLPYAIIFDITGIWISKMKQIYGDDYFSKHTPIWYVGVNAGSFSADSFTSSMDSISSSIASATSSSSGSGGSGGSGGGGGGGGGGGW